MGRRVHGTSVQNLRFFRPSVKCKEVTHQKIMSDNKEIGEKYGIHPRDVEKVKFAFDVYDFKGDGKVDGFYIGDLLRACNLNPTLSTINEVGGMKEKGKKIMVIDDFYPIFAKVKLAKNQDGTILGRELFRLLTNLGEKLTKEEAKGLMKELCEPEDDEGFMPFMPFLEKMCSNE